MGVGLVLLVVAFYLIRAGDSLFPAQMLRHAVSGEGLKLRDIHYTHDDTDEGIKWVLDAREIRFSENRSTIFFEDFRLKLEPKDKPWLQLTGKGGEYSRDSGDIRLWGELEGVSSDGYKLKTERIQINEKRRDLSSDERVRIWGPFFSLEGKGFSANLESKRFRVASEAITVLYKEPQI